MTEEEQEFEQGETYTFTARLTGNMRDIHTLSPKVLLTEITRHHDALEFRDHCWTNPSKRLQPLIPDGHSEKKAYISFTARVEKYMSSTGCKLGLRHLRNITLIKEPEYGNRA